MFVPDGKGRTFYIRLNKQIVFSIIFFLVILLGGSAFLLFYSGRVGLKLQHLKSLKNENERLTVDNKKLNEIVQKIETIDKANKYLSRLMTAVGEEGFVNPLNDPSGGLTDNTLFVNDSSDTGDYDEENKIPSEYLESGVSSVSREELFLAMPNISPVGGWITKRFVNDTIGSTLNHPGVDFVAKTGTLIRATAPGIVESVVVDTYYGLLIKVIHKYGFVTLYGHCSQSLVSKGDQVERGQTVALVGNTGRSSAPHLHYEVIKNGKHVDPLKYTFDRFE